MSIRNEAFENAIMEFIRNNPEMDSVDIVLHFKIRADIVLASLQQLVSDKKVIRKHLWGSRYGYVLNNEGGF